MGRKSTINSADGGITYPARVADIRIHGSDGQERGVAASSATMRLANALPAGRHHARGLYVHVPFCFHKCHYCDFYSFVDREGRSGDYLLRLAHDVTWTLGRVAGEIETVFVGGGTPTLLTVDELAQLCKEIRRFPLARQVEWTVEANPETIDLAKAQVLAEAGVNRVSLGAQSFDPRHLKTLERWHDPANVARAAGYLREAGIANFNIDLIFGVPGQTLAEWRADLTRALEIGPEHLSCYGLTYEANTAMTKRLERGEFEPCDDGLEAEMYEATVEMLATAGFARYEISNYARAGRECRHNLVYWRNESWWALGPSASGSIAGTRFKVVPRLGDWLARSADDSQPVVDVEEPDAARNTSEALMLGLRLAEGVSVDLEKRAVELEPARGRVISEAIESGFLERDTTAARLRFTARGMILANEVLVQLI
ncbi:MAG: radical SAM family heme chaperone HemW [Limnohabitans sp.]|jgi:oxygen-independent coproporphyrinogen-3 oxidase|nr:radical SAM family heme chaperone HemW [Limnohabitans sp.]